MDMDGQPDVVSFEPRPRRHDWWPTAGRGGRIAIVVVLLACLGVITSLALVVVAVRARPGAAPVTWLFVYGQHADPGQRYGLLEGTCGGQYVTASDLADGVADLRGDLSITAQDPAIGAQSPGAWVMLYRWKDGAPLGGVEGPLTGSQAKAFRVCATVLSGPLLGHRRPAARRDQASLIAVDHRLGSVP